MGEECEPGGLWAGVLDPVPDDGGRGALAVGDELSAEEQGLDEAAMVEKRVEDTFGSPWVGGEPD